MKKHMNHGVYIEKYKEKIRNKRKDVGRTQIGRGRRVKPGKPGEACSSFVVACYYPNRFEAIM